MRKHSLGCAFFLLYCPRKLTFSRVPANRLWLGLMVGGVQSHRTGEERMLSSFVCLFSALSRLPAR